MFIKTNINPSEITAENFQGLLSGHNGNVTPLILSGYAIKGKLNLTSKEFVNITTLQIIDCSFDDNVTFQNLTIKTQIIFTESVFSKSLTFLNCKSGDTIHSSKDQKFTLLFDKCTIENLDLTQHNTLSWGLVVSSCKENLFKIKNLITVNRAIRIRKIEFNEMTINKVSCINTTEGVSISESKIKRRFQSHRSKWVKGQN